MSSSHSLGAQIKITNETKGTNFSVWAPNAQEVRVVGDFNCWKGENHQMLRSEDGVWSLFVPEVFEGMLYKYEILTPEGVFLMKADPFAYYSECRPNTASIVYDLSGYKWNDQNWRRSRARKSSYHNPMMIYEVHLGSWKKKENGQFYTYRELADELIEYVLELNYTHIEILPIVEHPYDRSWGYQGTGYYSVTSRYGTPHDFMYFVDQCHQHGLGVILDWVPGHFCRDEHGLYYFDGTPLYEYEEPYHADNKEWGTSNFNLGKPEVRDFLISNALFWMEIYHIDGLRIDAVSHMLFRQEQDMDGKPCVNQDAIEFLKKLNEAVFAKFPHALMMAEDSSDFPLVTAPTYEGGLGFNYKWNMGWMNDVLKYMELDPIFRKWNHHLLTFSLMYSFSENFVLPFSHDEVVHGKKSLLNKMFGSYEDKFNQLRLLFGYMMTHPGKKLLFMGNEFAQFDEWKDIEDLDWNLINFELHSKMKNYMKDWITFYKGEKALWELDYNPDGFEWIDPDNQDQSILSFIRRGKKSSDHLLVICNFTPVSYDNYLIGAPIEGAYQEVFSSDCMEYGGERRHKLEILETEREPWHNQLHRLSLTITPFVIKVLKPMKKVKRKSINKQKESNREVIIQ